MRALAVKGGSPNGKAIVPATFENLMAPQPLAIRFRTAWRNDPGPQELVLTTKFVEPGMSVTVAGAYRKLAAIDLSRSMSTLSGLSLPAASPDQMVKA